MNYRWLGVACALLLGACGKAEQSAAPAVASTPAASTSAALGMPAPLPDSAGMARYDGYGDLPFGVDQAVFARVWGGELKGASQPGSTCFYKTPKWVRLPADFAFMFVDGHFVRYDVGNAKEVAPGGGKVGMTAAQIRALYGARLVEQPHKYVAGANYLRVTAPQGDAVLVFETDEHGKVERWRAGVPPQVDYVEGCS